MGRGNDIQSSKITDKEIMDLYLDRDEDAISKTDIKYGNMLFSIAYNILYDPLDCEECKNDTYFATWKSIPPSLPTTFVAFISKIMRNFAIKKYKEKTSQKRIPSEMTVSMEELQDMLHCSNTLEEEYTAKELGEIIGEYVRSLPERQRFVFFERFYLGETIENIAKEYSLGVGTVHREINKIKQGLRTYLEGKGVLHI